MPFPGMCIGCGRDPDLMKKRTKKIFLLSAGALVLVAGSSMAYGIYSFMSAPVFGEEPDDKPDDVLIANFLTHRAEFERVREMLAEDTTITRVGDSWTDPSTLDPARVAEYRRLFKIIGTPRGITVSHYRGSIEFMSTGHGWVASSSSKGYLYFMGDPILKGGPLKLVDSLDGYGWHSEHTFVVRHIEGPWYLYFERS